MEVTFGRIKSQFRMAGHLLRNLNVPSFPDLLKIMCAILNKYHSRFTPDRNCEEEICERICSRMDRINKLIESVVQEGLDRSHQGFKSYNPEGGLVRSLNDTESYLLATGSYLPISMNSYKARFVEMNLQPTVRHEVMVEPIW